MKKMLFVVNPVAGKNALKNHLLPIIDIFVKGGYDVTVYTTQAPKDLARVVIERGAEFDILVFSGGDGSLNEAANALQKAGITLPIGYIPGGTMNDFATTHFLPKDPIKAAEQIVSGQVRKSDLGCIAGQYFVYVAAFGLFTEASYQTPQNLKNSLGKAAYILDGIRELGSIKSYRMRFQTDDNTIEDEFIYGMLTNTRSIGGLKLQIAKDALLDDGLMEVTLIKRPQNLTEMNTLIGALVTQTADSNLMYHFQTSSISIETDEEIPWTLDGEFGGKLGSVEVVDIQNGLSFIA